MATIDETHAEGGRTLALFVAVAWAVAVQILRLIRLPAHAVLMMCEPVVRVGFTTVALLGTIVAFVLELSGRAPKFPFWGALLFFGCCGLMPHLYRAALRVLSP
jgi:hypothetical protein